MGTTPTTLEKVLAVPLVISAMVVAVLLIRRELATTPPPQSDLSVATVDDDDWQRMIDAPVAFGSQDAPVTIVEFGDFECPACKSFATNTLPRLRQEYPGHVRIIYRHRPLLQHRFARQAAAAAECARSRGHFESFHDLLYSKQDSLGLLPWGGLAIAVGIADSAGFEACVHEARQQILVIDSALADRLDVAAVPTIAINGLRLGGVPDFKRLSGLVDSILGRR